MATSRPCIASNGIHEYVYAGRVGTEHTQNSWTRWAYMICSRCLDTQVVKLPEKASFYNRLPFDSEEDEQ